MSPDTASSSLASIKHIVVLMMENRSFDHMLGYLGLPGGIEGVDGLQNAHPNFAADGIEYPPSTSPANRSRKASTHAIRLNA
jgi:phospholipase C